MRDRQVLAARAVGEVLEGRNLDRALEAIRAGQPDADPRQRAAVQDLAYGTLRFLGEVDGLLAALSHKPVPDPHLRCLLRVALYQLAHSRTPAHAVVDQAVRAAAGVGQPAARGLVNALLRRFLRERDACLEAAHRTDVGRWSHPLWWIDRVRTEYPDHWQGILEAGNRRPPMTLRVNRRRIDAAGWLALALAGGIEAQSTGGEAVALGRPLPVAELPGFAEGLVSVQDQGAQWAARLLDLADGQRVLDACAAPGGKTAHILETAAVDLVALDADEARLGRVRDNLRRLGLAARVVAGDAGAPADWWDGQPFDRILADLPCSASGVARRHPDAKWLRRESDIAGFAERQRSLLEALWHLLAPGGKLLYATCSVFAGENGRVVDDFISRHPEARRLELPGFPAPDGQLLPDAHHDGFFYALLGRT